MKDLFKKSYPHIAAIILFLIISAVYFSPQLKGYVLRQYDISQYIGMSKEIQDHRDKFHEEPLWTNSTFGGMPAYQISTKNTNIINSAKDLILKVFPRPIGYIFIMMAGFYILLLCFDVKPWLAVIGAIAFGLSSFNMLYLGNGHNAKVHALSFIPPIIGGIIYTYRKNIYTGAIITSIFTCLHLSSNHVQLTYYLLFMILAIVIVEFYLHYKQKMFAGFMKKSGILLIAGLLGILPTISNLVVTNEYGKHSTRGKSELTNATGDEMIDDKDALDPDYIKVYNLGKSEAWSLIIPNIKGGKMNAIGQHKDVIKTVDSRFRQNVAQFPSYWGEQLSSGGAFYIGASMFLLFILGLFFIKDKIKWGILGVTILAILLSFKNGFVIDLFISKFPLFNKFRDSKMMLYLVQISFPLMGILFIKYLINNEIDKKKFLYVSLGISGLLFLFYIMPTVWFDFLSKTEMQQFDDQMSQIRNNAAYLQQYEDFKTEIINARILIYKKDVLRSLLFILSTFVILYLFITKKIKENALIIAIAATVLVDLWVVDKRYLNNEKKGSQYFNWENKFNYHNPFQPVTADMDILNKELQENPELQKKIESKVATLKNKDHLKPAEFNLEKIKLYFTELNFATDYRVLSFQNPFSQARESYFHKSLGGYHGAKLRRINELIDHQIKNEMSMIAYSVEKNPDMQSLGQVQGLSTPALNMLNTKYILYKYEKPALNNPNHYGNAWFVKNIDIVDNADDEIKAIAEIDKETAVIQNKYSDKVNTSINYDTSAIITMRSYKPNHLVYKTAAASEQLALFSEIYYEDGWDAYIDGKKAEYIKANFLLRAMNIPEGEHTVEFKFEPESYYKSRKISYAGSSLLIIFILGCLILNYRKKEE